MANPILIETSFFPTLATASNAVGNVPECLATGLGRRCPLAIFLIMRCQVRGQLLCRQRSHPVEQLPLCPLPPAGWRDALIPHSDPCETLATFSNLNQPSRFWNVVLLFAISHVKFYRVTIICVISKDYFWVSFILVVLLFTFSNFLIKLIMIILQDIFIFIFLFLKHFWLFCQIYIFKINSFLLERQAYCLVFL